MRQVSRKRRLKLQHKFAHIRRNYYFHIEQQQQEPLPHIPEFEKLKALLADRMN
ncbi:Transposase [Shewanella livingstonensis]